MQSHFEVLKAGGATLVDITFPEDFSEFVFQLTIADDFPQLIMFILHPAPHFAFFQSV